MSSDKNFKPARLLLSRMGFAEEFKIRLWRREERDPRISELRCEGMRCKHHLCRQSFDTHAGKENIIIHYKNYWIRK